MFGIGRRSGLMVRHTSLIHDFDIGDKNFVRWERKLVLVKSFVNTVIF